MLDTSKAFAIQKLANQSRISVFDPIQELLFAISGFSFCNCKINFTDSFRFRIQRLQIL